MLNFSLPDYRINVLRRFAVLSFALSMFAFNMSAQMGSAANTLSNFGIKHGNFQAVNPAFQHIDSIGFVVALPTLSMSGANNNMSFDDVNYYFGNEKSKYLTDEDKRNLISAFDDNGRYYININGSIAKLYIGLKDLGTIGFEANDFINGNLILPKQLLELALIGNTIDRKYTFDDLNIKSWWVRNYAVNFANKIYKRDSESHSSIEELTIGVKLKYVQGFAYAGTESINSSFHTNLSDHSLQGSYKAIARTAFSPDLGIEYDFDSTYTPLRQYKVFPEAVGSGYGIDLGLNINFVSGFNLSLALNDLGSIKWDRHTVEHTMTGDFLINDVFDRDQLDSLADMNKDESKYIPEFSTALPLNLQIGSSIDISKYIRPFESWIWFINYSQGFNSAPGNSTKPILEIGNYFNFGEWIPAGLIAIRYDETGSLRIPAMINYSMDYFFIGFNTLDLLSLLSSSTAKPNYSAGITMGLKFH